VPRDTIRQVATTTPELRTLVSLSETANLGATLDGPGPYTVFAPVNSAFAALTPEQMAPLLAPENRVLLTRLLAHHVVPGRILAAQLAEGQLLTTLDGRALTVARDGSTRIDGARILTPDIVTANGVVHLVDGVLTQGLDVLDLATLVGRSAFVAAVRATNLAAAVRGNVSGSGLTVLAPSDAAFAAIPGGVPTDAAALERVVQLHLWGATALPERLTDAQTLLTLRLTPLTIGVTGGEVRITGPANTVRVRSPVLRASNGVLLAADGVLLP
jgi:uncharacterized surface protein with fasciclin (FAS1) repeats